ncbi:MAG: helix-turn-helix domain-containing protein, partial [Erysipelotrichales bacterium]|nr:helix-turn-helix domain-containing protein [Erysipelotrichales bacterium]
MIERKIDTLIQYLLEFNDFITIEHISKNLNFSVRTIHNYLNSPYFKKMTKNTLVLKVPNKGVFLKTDEKTKHHIMSMIKSNFIINLSISNDLLKIVFRLLCDDEKTNTQTLATYLYRSESSIQLILKEVEMYIASFSCELCFRKNQGVHIIGNEYDIRSLFLFSLKKLNEGDDIYYRSRVSAHSQHIAKLFLTSKETSSLLKIINHVESISSYYCDTDYNLLILHLIILILRVKKGHYINTCNNNIVDLPEYQISITVKYYLENQFNLSIDNNELNYITLILLSLRKQVNSIPIIEERTILNNFINLLSYKLNSNLNNDHQLKYNL